MSNNIACNPFVWRQTRESKFSYYAGSFAELVALVERHFGKAVPGDKPNCVKVVLEGDDARGFFSSVVDLEEEPHTELGATYDRRPGSLDGEQRCIGWYAKTGKKMPAAVVEIVLYNKVALSVAERMYTPEDELEPVVVDAEWQIITINARSTHEPEPLHFFAMLRNEDARLELPSGVGGTPAEYTKEDYRNSLRYWKGKAMFRGA